jgi:hypothetical protein
MMQTNSVLYFVKNKDPKKNDLNDKAQIFCIPAMKIHEATKFCKREELDCAYVGFRFGEWKIDGDDLGMDPCIKINREGIHPETTRNYFYSAVRIAPLSVPDELHESLWTNRPN